MKEFTSRQKEIVARKLGYDGPMQGFDEFLASDPALQMRYTALSGKFAEKMANGGMVKKRLNFAAGGFTDAQVAAYIRDNNLSPEQAQQAAAAFGISASQVASAQNLIASGSPAVQQASETYAAQVADRPDLVAQNAAVNASIFNAPTPTPAPKPAPAPTPAPKPAPAPTPAPAPSFGGGPFVGPTTAPVDTQGQMSAAPRIATTPTVTAAETQVTPEMTPTATTAGAAAPPAVTTTAAAAAPVTAAGVAAPTAQAAQATPAVTGAMQGVAAEQGAVSEQAQVTAAQMAPTSTAVSGLEAAQGQAAQVVGAPTRTVQEGEMVSGPAVDMAKVEQTLAQQQAAQGVVTEEMTVQGQLNKLMRDFDAGNPPPWAAATMRTATAQMAARGLSASSMAGQAIIQAALEAATPLAAADAKVFETMGLQNLSNRQQMSMLVAQQRAQFLGQEFDQAFQTRVLNAARVADIANKNFDAQTQIAVENARLTNSMDLANLSARNALVLAEAAQISQLETQNLSNLQQAAVENAKAFLAMDMQNLSNRQQTTLFKAQSITNAMLQDASLQNAINITNATNALDAQKISAQLKLQAETFNAAEQTKVNLANAAAANELERFNAQQQNARDEFNANMATQVSMANAKVLAEVSTANTAAINAANALNARNAVELTSAEYAQLSQTYRDMLEMSWKTGESAKDRATEIAKANIVADAQRAVAASNADAAAAAKIGEGAIDVLKNWSDVKAAVTDTWKWVTSISSKTSSDE